MVSRLLKNTDIAIIICSPRSARTFSLPFPSGATRAKNQKMPACDNESIAATYNLSSFFLGYYLYAETSGILKGDQAQLVSLTFPATKGRCMTFWYHMYGSGMGDLNVYVNINGTKHKVWTMSGDQGDEWKMARVTLVSKGYPYQVNTTYKSFFKSFLHPA